MRSTTWSSSALNDGFATDVLESARHLARDTTRSRSAAPWCSAIVLLQLKDLAAAREVLERAIARHGENPYLLANLARAYAAAGDDDRAQALIWRALELDPNEETALNWLIGMSASPGGQEAVLGRLHARGGAARQLARAAVARAVCAGARRSRRSDAAVRRGAGARQAGARRTCSCS